MVILINGSINAGKSTVGKLIADALPQTALLEIDVLRDMVAWMPLETSIPLNLSNAVSIIKNFAAAGLNVVVPYPLSEANYAYLVASLGPEKIEVRAFSLAPRLDVALTNRGTRVLTDAERERVHYHYNKGIPTPTFGTIIDNSEQSPEETSRIIMDELA